MIKKMSIVTAGLGLSGFLTVATAASVTIPNTFTSGTKAVAAQVNGNFTAVKTAVDDNNSRIAKLEATIKTLQTSLAKVTALNLDQYMVYTDVKGYRKVQFKGVDVQVVNGTGKENTTNGEGNLIVGYNIPSGGGGPVCSDGQYTDQNTCTNNNDTWATNFKSGSHNLVVGDGNSYSQYGGVVFGEQNVINSGYAVVSGGQFNIASGIDSSVSGGTINTASGLISSVSGGAGNIASGDYSSVSGGKRNTASGETSSVSGGYDSTASGGSSSVSGGTINTASGQYSSVSGGYINTASGDYSSVSGGSTHTAAGTDNWAAGSLSESQ